MIARFNEQSGREVIELPHWHFCDNEQDANDCALLVLNGVKQATTPSLYWFKANNEALPEVGDLAIFTNWQGQPLGIIETVSVTITPYNQISADYAIRRRGDKSLEYWRVYIGIIISESSQVQVSMSPSMPLV